MYDGIWDDGEWISWNTINYQINEQELRLKYPNILTLKQKCLRKEIYQKVQVK